MKRALVLLLMLSALPGCSTLTETAADFPLRHDRPVIAFPQGAEVTAALTLTQAGRVEEYLLALHSSGDGVQGALLTPQGIPLATFATVDHRRRVATQARSGRLLSPIQLLDYLELSYSSVANGPALLKSDWCAVETGVERLFVRHCGNTSSDVYETAAFSLTYQGSKPWYQTIVLYDVARALTMRLRILEHSNAVSE